MQKLINVIALLSGLTSLAVIGGGAYVFMNQEAWKAEAKERFQEIVVDSVVGILDNSVPLPETTGPAIPLQMP
jgi:hypothetical protein